MFPLEQHESHVSRYGGECWGCGECRLISGRVRHSCCWIRRARTSLSTFWYLRWEVGEKWERGEIGESGSSPEWNCLRCCRCGWAVFCPCGDLSKEREDFPMPKKSTAIPVDETKEYVDVVGSSTPCIVMRSPRESRSESPWVMLSRENQATFLISLAFPWVSFCFFSSSFFFSFSWLDSLFVHYEILFKASFIRAHYVLKMASWRCCILVYNLFGEPAGCPECSRAIVTEPSGLEFELGAATSKNTVRKRLPGKAASWISLGVSFHHI